MRRVSFCEYNKIIIIIMMMLFPSSSWSALVGLFAVVVLALFVDIRLKSLGMLSSSSSSSSSPVTMIQLPPLPLLPPTTDKNRLDQKVEIIGENDLVGPESLVVVTTNNHFGTNNNNNHNNVVMMMFAALGDGRIVRLSETHNNDTTNNPVVLEWTTLIRTGQLLVNDNDYDDDDEEAAAKAKCETWGGPTDIFNTEKFCGRPLGLAIVKRSSVDNNVTEEEDRDQDVLIVADAIRGLLMISGIHPGEENVTQLVVLATRARSDPEEYTFQLLNGLVQAPDGSLYMTETTTQFQRRRIFHAVFHGQKNGRLLKFQKEDGTVEVVADSLYMPNGITVSHDGKELLIVAGVQVLRFSLSTLVMQDEPFISVLPGTGDNIKTLSHLPSGTARRCYWAGLGSKYAQPFSLLKTLSNKPRVRALLVALIPYRIIVNLIPKFSAFCVYDEEGNLLELYRDDQVTAPWLSEAEPMGSYIYLGSWFNPFLARVKIQDLL